MITAPTTNAKIPPQAWVATTLIIGAVALAASSYGWTRWGDGFSYLDTVSTASDGSDSDLVMVLWWGGGVLTLLVLVVAGLVAVAFGDLTEFLAQVNARLKASAVVHFDETGLRCEGRNRWLHSASTPAWSRRFFHRKRGTEAMAEMNVLPGFTGTAVHDAWASYDTYTAPRHALCNAHLLRELQAVTDNHHATTDIPNAWCWAEQVSDALLTLHKAAAAHPDTPVDPAIIAAETTKIRHALVAATRPAGAIGRKHRALARRIHRREVDYLKFASDPAIPFTNYADVRTMPMLV